MRRHAHSSSQPQSLRTFLLFCGGVFLLVVLSLGFKTVKLLQESTFNEQDRFTVVFIEQNQSVIYSVDPEAKAISSLTITSQEKVPALSRFLGLPIDAVVTVKKDGAHSYTPKQFFSSLLFRPLRFRTEQLTIIDKMRLFLFSESVSDGQVEEGAVVYPAEQEEVDEIVQSLFEESLISKENATIEIVNASGVAGLGTRMERMLVNMGATVIAVKSAQKNSQHSSISYHVEDSPTLRRISDVLSYDLQAATKQTIADITITIGEDKKEGTLF